MIRVGQVGDLHLTSGRRFADTARVLDWVADDGAAHGVQLWLVGGDLAGTSDVPHVASVQERDFLTKWFQRLAERACVVLIAGNHDSVPLDLQVYGRLESVHSIHVVTEPRAIKVRLDPSSPDSSPVATIFCVPYPRKIELLAAATGTIRDQNTEAADALRAQLAMWAAAASADGPRIYFGHHNVRGSQLSGDEILANKEVELTAEDLDAFPADYIALAHIHLFQRVGQKGCYAGSPSAQSFGETDEKGYLIVDVEPDAAPIIQRRLTPARRLVTVTARWVHAGGEWRWLADPEHDLAAIPAGAEVRLAVEIPEEAASSCPVDALRMRFAAIAHEVVVERKLVPKQRVRSEAIRTAQTNVDRLTAWWGSLGSHAPKAPDQDRLLSKLAELEHEVAGGEPVDREDAAA